MKASNSRSGLRWKHWRLLWPALILLAGIGGGAWQGGQIDQQMRGDLLDEAQRLVDTLNVDHVMALSGTPADLTRPEYQRLKRQFQAVRGAFPQYRFIYLLGRAPDDTVIIQIDSEPPGAEDESLPGDVFSEITEEERGVFHHKHPLTVGPAEDRWGVWVSALVPVKLPQPGPYQVVLGIDIDARDWRQRVLVRAVVPTGLVTLALLLIGLVGVTLLDARATQPEEPTERLRYLEPALIIAVGLVLTMYLAYLFQSGSMRGQARNFSLLAEVRTESLSQGLRNLRDFELEGLARFFQASDDVTIRDFAHYTEFLRRKDLVRQWAWAPQVAGARRNEFERMAAADGLTDFRIWERGADGESRPAADREHFFPISRLAPDTQSAALLGLDLALDPRLASVLEQALATQLVTASEPIKSPHWPDGGSEMLVMHPTVADTGLGPAPGIVVTTLHFDQLLASAVSDDLLTMELIRLRQDGSHERMSRFDSGTGEQQHPLRFTRPILVFGEAFVVRARATPAFLRTHPVRAGLTSVLVGLALTLMLATIAILLVRRRDSLEQEVREQTLALQEFRVAVEQSGEGIALSDMAGTIRFVNRAWASMHGYTPEDLVGRHFNTFQTSSQLAGNLERPLDRLLRKGQSSGEVDHRHKDGHTFPTRMTTSLARNERGRPFGIIDVAQDITEEVRRREKDRFDQRFQALVAEIAAGFVTAGDDHRLKRVIANALTTLGELFGADRSYLFRFSNDQKTMRNTHEWCAPGISAHQHEQQQMDTASMPWWLSRMQEKRSLQITNVAELPDAAATERANFQAQSIQSLLCLPVTDETHRLIGFMGFDSVREARTWSREHVSMLQVIADIVAAALGRRDAARALADSEARYRDLATESRSYRWEVDLNGLYTNADELVTEILGYRPDELIGKKHFHDLAPEEDREAVRSAGLEYIREGRRHSGYENRVTHRDGTVLWVSTAMLPLLDGHGQVIGAGGLDTEITDSKQVELQLQHLAQHDLLTGLPNRVLLADRLQQAMLHAKRHDELLGVAYVDLDAFKPINDEYGHEAGDRLLVTVAHRMRAVLREGDTVARIGGDEFALVLVGLHDIETARPLLQRLLDAAAEPVEEQEHMLQVSVSLGVTFYPQSEDIDADQLLRQADQAMYQAKLAGKNRYSLFDDVHDRRLRDNHQQIERIQLGLQAGEFVLHYQPKVDMKKGCVVGVEALIRWQHPDQGLLFPDAFLPQLQRHKLMLRLGDWVIDAVLIQITKWRETGIVLPVSLNVDPLQLAQADFIAQLKHALARYPVVHPEDLELELLETSALDESVSMGEIIRAGSELGVSFALDDFGTGYSSLAYLKRLPVNNLKIDRSFVGDMLADPDDLAILQGVISLARTFRQTVIAEGVETEAHGKLLLQLGCNLGQGYAIARPMPAEAIPEWLTRWVPPKSWLDVEPVDSDHLPFLVAIVEFRAWSDRLRKFLSGDERTQAPPGQPAAEWVEWLEKKADRNAASDRCLHLQAELARLGAELLDLAESEHRDHALLRFAEIETARDAMLEALRSKVAQAP